MILTIVAQASAPLAAFDNGKFLAAIVQVEGHKWSDPGGAYAIQPKTWNQYTTKSYYLASWKLHADDIANRHIAWLSRCLRTDGYPVNAYTLAVCWRFGYAGFVARARQGGGAVRYGERVWNLYQHTQHAQSDRQPTPTGEK